MRAKVSIVMVTRNRCDVLARTVERCRCAAPEAEIIVVDNGSTDGTAAWLEEVQGAWGVRALPMGRNLGASARNVGARQARGEFVLMLDDDSWPMPGAVEALVGAMEADRCVGAAGARVTLDAGGARHETGGLAGVFIGCGVMLRREAFLALGGYDARYEYYVEEYDLAARMWQSGRRVCWVYDAVVVHERAGAARNYDRMLRLLTRNNVWFWQRYAPEGLREAMVAETLERYRRIAVREAALAGYEAGVAESAVRPPGWPRTPLTMEQFEALYGFEAVRARLARAGVGAGSVVAVFGRGKGAEQLLWILEERGAVVEAVYDGEVEGPVRWRGQAVLPAEQMDESEAEAVIVGSLSPGVAVDWWRALRGQAGGRVVIDPVGWSDRVVSESVACAGR